MKSEDLLETSLPIDPNNKNYTVPRSYGVYELPSGSKGRAFRYGNYPIRKTELEREFGEVKVVSLYLNRDTAESRCKILNDAKI